MNKNTYAALLFTVFIMVFVAMQPQVSAASSIQAKEVKYDIAKISVKYPQFEGFSNEYVQNKINMDIKVAVDKFVAGCQSDSRDVEAVVGYEVHYTDADKLSFELTTYEFTGGAHGMTFVTGYNYNVKTGERYSLAQLFDFKPSEINKTIFSFAKERDIFLFSDFKGIKEYPRNFYLKKDTGKAVVLFQQYEIAPYSSGILRIEMP